MAKARNRRDRCIQILSWLKEEFDLPACRFEWMESIDWYEGKGEMTLGQTLEVRGNLTIQISEAGCRTKSQAIETTIHEAAHVKLWEEGTGFLHGDKFWRCYGRMADAYEHHGFMDSQALPFD